MPPTVQGQRYRPPKPCTRVESTHTVTDECMGGLDNAIACPTCSPLLLQMASILHDATFKLTNMHTLHIGSDQDSFSTSSHSSFFEIHSCNELPSFFH